MLLFTKTRQKRLVLSTVIIEEELAGEDLTFLPIEPSREASFGGISGNFRQQELNVSQAHQANILKNNDTINVAFYSRS